MRDKYSFSLSLEKGLNILGLFIESKGGLSLAEIQRKTGYSKTVVFRFANTLVELGFLARDPQAKVLRLGRRAVVFGSGILQNFDLVDLVKPVIDEVHERYQVTADAALFHDDTLAVIYRRQVQATLPFRLPWMNKEWHCTALGKAVLSAMPAGEAAALLGQLPLTRRTDKTITDRAELLEELEATRRRGYSLNDEECYPGFLSIGAPLVSPGDGRVLGAVSFDFSTVGQTMAGISRRYGRVIIEMSRKISATLPMI